MKDYKKRIENLKARRQDDQLQKAILSESFSNKSYGESVKYVLEAMLEIDPRYTANTYEASKKIQNHLFPGLKQHGLEIEFRHQGSTETNTHIKVHSDIDLLVLTKKFETLEHPQVPKYPYSGDPLLDLKELREKSHTILDSVYDTVDNTGGKAIAVTLTNPKRKVDVISSNWFNTNDYATYGNETIRGIHIYDKDKHVRMSDLPFLHIHLVNKKDLQVGGSLKKAIRLLKTLKADADTTINLSSYAITGIVYDMSLSDLTVPAYATLQLLLSTSKQLEKIITDKSYRENLTVPNQTEKIFGSDTSKIEEVKKLKIELDEIIVDLGNELSLLNKNFSNVEY